MIKIHFILIFILSGIVYSDDEVSEVPIINETDQEFVEPQEPAASFEETPNYDYSPSTSSSNFNYDSSSQKNLSFQNITSPKKTLAIPPEDKKVVNEENFELISKSKCLGLDIENKDYTLFLSKSSDELYLKAKTKKLKGISSTLSEETAVKIKEIFYFSEKYDEYMENYAWMNFQTNYVDSLAKEIVCRFIQSSQKDLNVSDEKYLLYLVENYKTYNKQAATLFKGIQKKVKDYLHSIQSKSNQEKNWIKELDLKAQKSINI